nr:MAG TPA: hypothetical protein [Caudoviricetes sp.]
MACLTKIQSAITYDCDGGNTGLLSALLINKEDIASITFDPTNPALVTAITLKEAAAAYKIDTVKRTLVTTESLKVNEGAPNAFTHSATIVVTEAVTAVLFRNLINPMANGSFVILTQALRSPSSSESTNVARAFGLYYGMSVTSIERSSHENGGWFTITMATPERVIGEDALQSSPALYSTLYDAAIG